MPPPLTVAVIIPALNEELALPRVLADLPWEHVDQVIVVDNGSTDGTARVARAAQATVVREPRRGYGQACMAGLATLGAHPPGVVVILDADHSDHAEELPRLLEPLRAGVADLVIGSRILGERQAGALAAHARWGNALAIQLIWMRHGRRFTDLGPFRAVRWETLRSLNMQDRNYGWNVEMQVKAVRQGWRCLEVPVSYRRRTGRSKISGSATQSARAGLKILWQALRSP